MYTIYQVKPMEGEMKQRQTARLETISELYDVPLWTLRKWASKRMFPGIIQRKGTRRIYVDVEKFDTWLRSEAEGAGEGGE